MKKVKYVFVLLPVLLIVFIVTTNSIASSQSYKLTNSVTSGPWVLKYEVTKKGKEDWQLDQFLFSRGEVKVRELIMYTESSNLGSDEIGRIEMKSVDHITFTNQLASSSEYIGLSNTSRVDEEEMRQILSKLTTTILWKEEGQGEQELKITLGE
ncbi:hypothetical protein MKY84_13410 [Chryseomicrobium sp. FSL W7-1435]|uniref:hypothetical protein n=1 Tax=Chryseomicrobium sp. FSL W7-1435 TaxID=2921704 RepID=UPI003159FEFA